MYRQSQHCLIWCDFFVGRHRQEYIQASQIDPEHEHAFKPHAHFARFKICG